MKGRRRSRDGGPPTQQEYSMKIRLTQRQASALTRHLGREFAKDEMVPVQTFISAFDAVLDVAEFQDRKIGELETLIRLRLEDSLRAVARGKCGRGGASR